MGRAVLDKVILPDPVLVVHLAGMDMPVSGDQHRIACKWEARCCRHLEHHKVLGAKTVASTYPEGKGLDLWHARVLREYL